MRGADLLHARPTPETQFPESNSAVDNGITPVSSRVTAFNPQITNSVKALGLRKVQNIIRLT